VVAADEDMIRHSVAKHFGDPNVTHVRDYLDKVIQVPMRVPHVGVEDLRAYMYSLFVEVAAPDKLVDVQERLLKALQEGWSGKTFDKAEIDELAGKPQGLLDDLAVADGLAPILATAPDVLGNPRIVKRLLNAISLRRVLASKREIKVDLATLAKLAVFERCTDGPATLELYRLIMDGDGVERVLLPPDEKGATPSGEVVNWSGHADFIDNWRRMDPRFADAKALRPAVFLSRDVLAPARRQAGLSDAAQAALEALRKTTSINSPACNAAIGPVPAADRRAIMSSLIEELRLADWSDMPAGLHGAIILSQASPDGAAELKAFVGTIPQGQIQKGARFLLRQAGLIPK
jgi:predicted KAP-like P-loop ATPase